MVLPVTLAGKDLALAIFLESLTKNCSLKRHTCLNSPNDVRHLFAISCLPLAESAPPRVSSKLLKSTTMSFSHALYR